MRQILTQHVWVWHFIFHGVNCKFQRVSRVTYNKLPLDSTAHNIKLINTETVWLMQSDTTSRHEHGLVSKQH